MRLSLLVTPVCVLSLAACGSDDSSAPLPDGSTELDASDAADATTSSDASPAEAGSGGDAADATPDGVDASDASEDAADATGDADEAADAGDAGDASDAADAAPVAATLGGTASGVVGTGLVLVNGTEQLPITGNGPFTFQESLLPGTTYAVTVASAAAGQSCAVLHGNGSIASGNVTDITVTCGGYVGAYVQEADMEFRGANTLGAQPITVPAATSLFAFGSIPLQAGVAFKMALYTNVNGAPSALVASMPETTTIDGRQEVAVAPVALAAGTYWLATDYAADTAVPCGTQRSTSLFGAPFAEATALPATFPAGMLYGSDLPLNDYILTNP